VILPLAVGSIPAATLHDSNLPKLQFSSDDERASEGR
jgi:hypothetical protein